MWMIPIKQNKTKQKQKQKQKTFLILLERRVLWNSLDKILINAKTSIRKPLFHIMNNNFFWAQSFVLSSSLLLCDYLDVFVTIFPFLFRERQFSGFISLPVFSSIFFVFDILMFLDVYMFVYIFLYGNKENWIELNWIELNWNFVLFSKTF